MEGKGSFTTLDFPRKQHWSERGPSWCVLGAILGLKAIVLGIVAVATLHGHTIICWMAVSSRATHQETRGEPESTLEGNSCREIMQEFQEDLCVHKLGAVCELCPQGWLLHRHSCYYFSEERKSWEDSVRDCEARRSRLLVLTDEAEMDFVSSHKEEDYYFWIGLHFQEKEGKWLWLGQPELHGYRGALNGSRDQQNCVAFRNKKEIHPDRCLSSYKWICKKNSTRLNT
ncbi:killer cell lectin-like receptor subfamily F member 1 [Tachyglossus aculeatus]|uniref:killer cell lectin-like receptor subfamily F member 1 n=1 Tax=Tachyglossus aculeatus TaxID=9261 RepID=UPI0018F4428E|nr:killer cell lectin-like receptor subfamily F member 1 [Tachyglossus aculeatus]